MSVDSYLPDSLKGKCRPKTVHFLKMGFVGLRLGSTLTKLLDSDDDSLTEKFSTALRELFEKSANVMEIQPKRAKTESDAGFNGYRSVLGDNHMALSQAFELRVALSEEQRYRFGSLQPAPEQLWIHYDGELFLAAAEADYPLAPWGVGQAAREFIESVVEQGTAWKPMDGIGPTPIHPGFYLVGVEFDENDSRPLDCGIRPISIAGGNLMILYRGGTPLTTVMKELRSGIELGLTLFYNARIDSAWIDSKLEELSEVNEKLSGLMAEFFNRNRVCVIGTRVTRRIRRLLSQGHIRLQEISQRELIVKKRCKEMNSAIEKNAVLEPISQYLNDRASEHGEIDKEAQLKLMDYAASETTSFSVIQATVWASVIGAAVGSLMTLFLR